MRGALVVVLICAGCFSPNPPRLAPCQVDEECPSSQQCMFGQCSDNDEHGARIGFSEATSLEDELSGTVTLTVVLTHPALVPVTVDYGVVGGTATDSVDYTFTPGSLSFAPGETEQSFQLSIVLDAEEEMDETIELALSSASGGVLGSATHTVTISANVLSRVSVGTAAASGQESTTGTVDVVLDAPSGLTLMVDYSVAGTATGGGVDHALAAGTLIFAPGETTKPLALGIVNDALDETDETVVVTIDNVANGKIGLVPAETYTILDDDATPTVRFSSATASGTENNTTVNVTVTLSAVSGQDVTVAFTAGVGTATLGVDYNYASTSPLTISAGSLTKSLAVTIIEDTAAELDETVVTTLSAPTNATLGSPTTNTLTILDDDRTCYGTGNSLVCTATPVSAVSLPASINTDVSGLCQGTQPLGWAGQGQPMVCLIVGTTIDVPGVTTVTGSRPLVLAATDITLGGSLDVSSRRGGTAGPGSPSLSCGAFPVTPDNRNGGGGGGAGGTFVSRGGNGGTGDGGQGAGGVSPNASAAPSVLRAGCDGQLAGKSSNDNPGPIGRGGGAVYLVANNAITITGSINASGSAGTLGSQQAGGSGAGSGGMIKLYAAAALNVTGAILIANGAGGAGGGGSGSSGASGSDPSLGTPTTQAAGGVSAGGDGGAGFAGGIAAVIGVSGGAGTGGGGGGGGGGFIVSNLTLATATTSAGIVQAP